MTQYQTDTVFDTKLTFKNHVEYLKPSCQKVLDILQVVEHNDWGANRIILLCLYHVLVCSKLDYRCIVYALARRSVLKQLDLIHHQGLRIATIRACVLLFALLLLPKVSVEAHEPSLASRQLKLSLNYVLKLKSLRENPAYSCVFEPENVKQYEESESKIPPLDIRILLHLGKNPQ